MKKILDSRFLFIVALSLVVLIVLGIGAFYLFDDSDAVFVKNGYVLNPLSAKSEKYFFDENTSYKENLSAMIEFKDTDNIDVTILKDSFLHYTDGGMSFLKNGAILNLDSINGKDVVELYNITNKSIIDKSTNGYVIDSKNGTINFKNFVGRINDDKYIVAGNLEAKIPGNTNNVKADYFEIVYTEEGIVNIENKDNKFQVAAEGVIIYAGDVAIDLGAKKIVKGDTDIMSITAITIDGNENIEIIPKAKEEEPSKPNNTANNNGNGNGNGGNDNQPNNNNPAPSTGSPASNPSGSASEPSQSKPDETDVPVTPEDIKIKLADATVGTTGASLKFDLENLQTEDDFNLRVTNLDTGRTVDIENVDSGKDVEIGNLSPGTKYLFTLVNSRDGGKYYQKILETKSFGITLEKSYATDSSLAYSVTVDNESDVSNATLSIMKYNEDKKRLEPVVVTVVDDDGNEITHEKTIQLKNLQGGAKGKHEILFDELDSNTIYTAVLNGIVLGGANNGSTYEMSETNLTLKQKPKFSSLNAVPGVDNNSFKLSIEGIEDPDNAIVSYTYHIYDRLDAEGKEVISPIVKTDSSMIEIPFGDGANELKHDTEDVMHKYYYQVVIKYFDNEKNIEYVTGNSIDFSIGTEPHITVDPIEDAISYNYIEADIYLLDSSCAIKIPGRYGCDGENQIFVRISRDGSNGEKITYTSLNALDSENGLTSSENGYVYHLKLPDLPADTRFYVDLEVLDSNGRFVPLAHTSESSIYVSTASLSSFTVDWDIRRSQAESGPTHVIYLAPKLIGVPNSGTLSFDKTAAAIKKVKFELYEGDDTAAVTDHLVEPIATTVITKLDMNIADKFYDNRGEITSDGTFGLRYNSENSTLVDSLGREFALKENYTIAMYAYYDDDKQITLKERVTPYAVSPALFNVVEDPEITATDIKKEDVDFTDDVITKNLIDGGKTVGYDILARYDRTSLVASGMTPTRIHIFVYRADGTQVKFYTYENGTRSEKMEINDEVGEGFSYPATIYLTYGSAYGEADNYMRRGERYYIGYYLDTETESGPRKYSGSETAECNRLETRLYNNGIGCYTPLLAPAKDTPSVIVYPYTSTATNITYSYSVKDPDNAIVKDSNGKYNFYYALKDSTNVTAFELTKVDGEYNTFKGDNLLIDNLVKNNKYHLYYLKNIMNTGDASVDISPYYVAESEEGRLFDGYYEASDYQFKYKVLTAEDDGDDSDYNNKVTIEILASDEVFNRIVSYRVKFSDGTYTVIKDKDIYKFDTCEDGTVRCFSVPYGDFSNSTVKMKSLNNTRNYIYVTIEAYYDNGLTGFGIPVGNNEVNKYMVFQNNSFGETIGNYVTISAGGMPTTWAETLKIPKGHYTYSFVDNNNDGVDDNILYRSSLITNRSSYISFVMGENGYAGDTSKQIKTGTLNPKMVTKVDMDAYNNQDNFWFNSITPKFAIDNTIGMIDGAVVRMTLTGIADINDFCEGDVGTSCVNTGAQKYLYVEVWENEEDAINEDFSKVARPAIPVTITDNNPRNIFSARLDMLKNDTWYYYRVYAHLNKDGVNTNVKLLYDGTADLKFKSLSSSDLYNNLELDYQLPTLVSDEHYMDKKLHVMIYLDKYNGEAFDFNLGYAFCSTDDSTCGVAEGNTSLYKYNLPVDDLVTEFTNSGNKFVEDYIDISKGNANPLLDVDNFEFGKSYRVNVYAIFDYYVDKNTVATKRLYLNSGKSIKQLGSLDTPTIVSSRYANYDSVNDTYYIDFGIGIKDDSRVLRDGHYFIKLVDSSNQPVGDLQVLEDGVYVTKATGGNYTDYPLSISALQANSVIRITGLAGPNQPYKVSISSTAFLNNASEEISIDNRDVLIEKNYDIYTSNDYSVGFGSISYATTANSLVLYFIGGSNLKYDEAYNLINGNLHNRICRVNGTIQRSRIIDENSQNVGDEGTYEVFPVEYEIPLEKDFQYVSDGDSWRFVIDGKNGNTITFTEGPKYESKLIFTVCDIGTGNEVDSFTFEKNELTYAKSNN